MDSEQRKSLILQLFEDVSEIDALSVMDVLNVDTKTVTQDFMSLLSEGKITPTSPGHYSKPVNIQYYLRQPVYQRDAKIYNKYFLESYTPNHSFLL